MEFEMDVRVKVGIRGDLANVHEVCVALKAMREEFVERPGTEVRQNYGGMIRDRLCAGKKDPLRWPLARHLRKDKTARPCRCKRLKRSGWWSPPRRLRTDLGPVAFGGSMVECLRCGRRFAPKCEWPWESRAKACSVPWASGREQPGRRSAKTYDDGFEAKSVRTCWSRTAIYFEGRGYVKVCKYLTRAQARLFIHLEQWLETGIVGHRTTSIIESTIRELVRRLKKLGWNWSDQGAERMGRIVILCRYEGANWEAYWRERLGLQDRCQMKILWCRKAA